MTDQQQERTRNGQNNLKDLFVEIQDRLPRWCRTILEIQKELDGKTQATGNRKE